MQNGSSRNRRPQCVVQGCRNPRAASSTDDRVKKIPLCWPHMDLARAVDEESRRRARLDAYEAAAAAEGKRPEDMFWDPNVFESQHATELQRKWEDRRDLDRYRALIAAGKIADPNGKTHEQPNGIVYYLRVGSYIKIGWSSNLEKRMRSYPPDSLLLAVEPGTRKDEQRRHRMFAAHRTHGREWYAMVPSLLHHIDQTTRQHGTPDAVTFAARPVEIPQPRTPEPVTPRGWTGRRVS